MEVTKEMAHAMASWWGEKIGGKGSHHDNGDRGMTSLMASVLADSMNEMADQSKVDDFVEILTERIMNEVKERGYFSQWLLDCDYAPSKFLSDAAKDAGINPNNFPWKTSMTVYENSNGEMIVKASAGYAAPWVQIYPEVSQV